jgi:uncharacterized protein (DUF1015 family)
MSEQRRGATVRPFRALHFDPARVAFGAVVTPPFDVISPAQREELAARSPYNVVHLILPGDGHEADVHRMLCDWRGEGVLTQDPESCFYRVRQEYRAPDGTDHARDGFIALVQIEPYEDRVILPHERTRTGPIVGRLALLRATRAQLSPIFGIYHDPGRVVDATLVAGSAAEPDIDVTDDDGTRHRLWRVPGDGAAIVAALARSTILIADGHHRYATAMRYREEFGGDGGNADWALIYLANADDGLTIHPTHRVVHGVDAATSDALAEHLSADGLTVEGVADPIAALAAAGERAAMVIVRHDAEALLVRAGGAGMDAELAQDRLLTPLLGLDPATVAATDRIAYRHRAEDAVAAVAPGTIAVLVRAPSIAQVEEAALAGRMMPPKTTYFYPKTVDGMVFYGLDDCI